MQWLQNRYVFVRNIADMVSLCLTWNSTVLLKTSPIAEEKKRATDTSRGCNKTKLDGSTSACGHCEYSGNGGRHFHARTLLQRSGLAQVHELFAVCDIVVNMSENIHLAIPCHRACTSQTPFHCLTSLWQQDWYYMSQICTFAPLISLCIFIF